jgi:hypothetical protein
MTLATYSSGGQNNLAIGAGTIAANRWYSMALRIDPDGVFRYDATDDLGVSKVVTGSVAALPDSSGYNFIIGNDAIDLIRGDFKVAELRVYRPRYQSAASPTMSQPSAVYRIIAGFA